MAAPSRPPNFANYNVERRCYGCGRKLVAKTEAALWFVGWPTPAVYGTCCWTLAPHILEEAA